MQAYTVGRKWSSVLLPSRLRWNLDMVKVGQGAMTARTTGQTWVYSHPKQEICMVTVALTSVILVVCL